MYEKNRRKLAWTIRTVTGMTAEALHTVSLLATQDPRQHPGTTLALYYGAKGIKDFGMTCADYVMIDEAYLPSETPDFDT